MIRIKFEVEEPEEIPLPNKVVPKKKKKLDNSTTDSVAVGSKSIKTEPSELPLSLTTQLNRSLNIQSLLIQQRIQNGWTTNEQSIPIGTQQQQQSLISTKIEPIVPEQHQEVPLSLDQRSSSIPIGTQQQQQSLFSTKIEPIFPEIQKVLSFLNQSLSLIPNLNSEETTATTNCDIESEIDPANFSSNNNNDLDSGLISGVDPSSASSTAAQVAALSPPEAAVPLLVGKKPLPLGIPPLTLEEKKARQSEYNRLRYLRQKANPKPLEPEDMAEKRRRIKEYQRGFRQQLMANATPEQLKQIKLKKSEYARRQREKETDEQRKQRLERTKSYYRKRRKQLLDNATPEQLKLMRLKEAERFRQRTENETEEQRQRGLERGRRYYHTVRKQRCKQKRQ